MAVTERPPFPTDDAPAPHFDANGDPGAASVVDTTELRWFIGGPLPDDVRCWFTDADTTGAAEQRCDVYRLDGQADLGVKRRNQETLELKVRQSFGERIELAEGLAGRLELWRKWSPADGLVDDGWDGPWVDVHKIVVKRRFSVDGQEIALSDDTRTMTGAGCDVEIAAVTVDDTEAWSFAFAAFGPEPSRQSTLVACWQALVAAGPCPEEFARFIGQSRGYPEWLAMSTPADAPTPGLPLRV